MDGFALRPATHLVALLAVMGALTWALFVLFPHTRVTTVGLAVVFTVGGLWKARRRWRTRRVVAEALREHRDPGPQHRDVVDDAARVALAHPRADLWLQPLLAAGFALACIVIAWVRADRTLAWPAVPLLAWAVAIFVIMRRALRLADWWLSDPPAPMAADSKSP